MAVFKEIVHKVYRESILITIFSRSFTEFGRPGKNSPQGLQETFIPMELPTVQYLTRHNADGIAHCAIPD